MKKILLVLFYVIICFSLTGCGEEIVDNGDDISKQKEVIDNNGDEQDQDNYEFISTDNKLVFVDKSGNNYSVFYFDNENITKLETVVVYPTEELAQLAYQSAKNENPDEVITKSGKNIIIVQDASEYNGFTKSQLESALELAGYKISR